MSRRTSRSTSYTSGVSPVGPFRAKVVGVSGGLASIQIPRLGLNNVYEDVPYSGFVPSVGTDVWAFFIEGNPSRPMIIVSAEDSLSDINEIVAGTNLNGGGTGGSVTLNLDDDITLSTVTAVGFYGDLHGAIHILVKNVSGGPLTKGTPVYATGAVGASGAVEVQASLAGTGYTMPAMGLLDQDLANNGEGHVVVSGVLENIDTATPGYSVGVDLYVAVSGGLTTTRPTGSSELVQKVGKVIRVQQNNGEILVQGAGRVNDVPNSFSTSGDVTVGGDLTVNGTTVTLNTDLSVTGDATVTGDLTVNGTTVTLNTETLTVEDNIIVLNSNVSGTPSLNAGIEIERGTSSNRSFLWDESIDAWTINTGVDGNLLRLTGADDNLNISVSAGDFSILNSQQSNGIVIYDGTGGVEIFYNGSAVFEADSGGVKVGGSRILTVADEGPGNGLDADTLDGTHASGFVSTTNNSTLNSDSRNTRGPTRLYRRDNNSDYSVQTYWTGSRWRLYGYVGDSNHADTHVGYADSAGNADTTDGLHVHGGRNNEANKIVRTDGNGYIQAGWINTTSGSTTSTINRIYASNDAYVRYVTPATFRAQIINGQTIYPTTVDADYIVVQKSTTSSAYQNQALQVFNPTNNSNSVAGLTFHIAGQLAPVFRSWPGTGAGFDAGNQQGTGYTFLGASSFPVRSSERLKKNITSKPDEEVIPSILNALSVRTVVFDDNYTDGYWCEEEDCFKEYELCDCEDCEDCNAVKNHPLQRRHFNRRGMIAEELYEVFPEAVHLDIDGIPIGIDYAVLTVELLDAVKLLVLKNDEQDREIADLRSRIQALESV